MSNDQLNKGLPDRSSALQSVYVRVQASLAKYTIYT